MAFLESPRPGNWGPYGQVRRYWGNDAAIFPAPSPRSVLANFGVCCS